MSCISIIHERSLALNAMVADGMQEQLDALQVRHILWAM